MYAVVRIQMSLKLYGFYSVGSKSNPSIFQQRNDP